MAKKSPLLGSDLAKIDPKLRMVANGKAEVNEVRAEFCPAVQMAPEYSLESAVPPALQMSALAVTAAKAEKPATRGRQRELSDDVLVSVFVEREALKVSAAVSDICASMSGVQVTSERGRLATLEVPVSALPELAGAKSIARIEMGQTLRRPRPKISLATVSAPTKELRRFGASGGKNVLVGVIDVEGFDFAHPDFLDANGKTRFVSIWDQGGNVRPKPDGFTFGSHIKKENMDAAISAAPAQGLVAQLLEPQSAMERGSHGTHVASIAAGNRGVCRNAFLVGVLIDLPREDADRRKSFYDSTRVALAVEFILKEAERLKQELGLDALPVSINLSLGTNGHAHDGSSAVSRWLEHVLTTPGHAVTVAAGNAGQERAERPDDFGFIMGRIHTSGQIAARGLVNDIEWNVVGNGTMDVSENELEVWYSPSDRFAVSVKPPNADWIGPINPGQFIENRQLVDKTFLSVYNEIYHRANGANYIGVYLSPFFSPTQIIGVTPGRWTIRLHGVEVRDGRYHGWIERDDPAELGPVGQATAWRFPSFFTERSNVDESSVSSLGCGEQVLCIANLDEAGQRINISSSQGPTRDGRFKPDIAAPGTDIVAALGFSFDDDERWIAMTGTSMASPYACGVVGLMLAENPKLTAAQIRGIMQRTGRPLPNSDFRWKNDSGFGVLDPEACLNEVRQLATMEDIT